MGNCQCTIYDHQGLYCIWLTKPSSWYQSSYSIVQKLLSANNISNYLLGQIPSGQIHIISYETNDIVNCSHLYVILLLDNEI